MNYNYSALKGKKYKYSSDYWYLDIKNDELVLISTSSEIHHFYRFEQLHKFLYEKYIAVRPRRRVIVYVKEYDLVTKYYLRLLKYKPDLTDAIDIHITNVKKSVDPTTHKVKEEVTACTVLNFISLRSVKYYLGTDEIDNYQDAIDLMIRFASSHASKGFSGHLKDLVFSDIKQDDDELTPFSVLKALTEYGSLSSIVGVQAGVEFKKVHSYDFSSAFISWLLYEKFPTSFQPCQDLKRKEGYIHLVKMKFKGLKVKKTNFRTLSCVKGTDKTKVQTFLNTRVCQAHEFIYSFFYELEMPIINYSYTYESVEVLDCWESKLDYIPQDFRNKVLSFAKDKQAKKKAGQSYKAYKVILNRLWGLLVTSHDRNGMSLPMYKGMPFAWGYYVIALQKNLMIRIVKQVGEKNIVHMHTDSIKTTVDIDDFVFKLNSSRPLQYDIGLLEKECVYDKIYYFSAVRCKYIVNKKLGMKHGGIRTEDYEEFIKNKTYSKVRADSQIKITKSAELVLVGERTVVKRVYSTSIIAEDKNYG